MRTRCRRVVVAAGLLCLMASAGPTDARQRPDAPLVRYVVDVEGHPLTIWAREPPDARAVVLLVHGRTWSSRPDFDLQVPGDSRSVMRSLAARRVAAYAVDLRGYGATPRDATGWLTPRRAATDVARVLAWVRARHARLAPPALVGWSRGAAIAMMVATEAPDAVSALVLFGFALDPAAAFVEPRRPPAPPRTPNTAEAARSDFISPAVTPPAVIRAFVAQALEADPVLADLRGDDQFNDIDPGRIGAPVLVIYGARDPSLTPTLVDRMLAAFPTRPTVVVLPGADHAAHLEQTHEAWVAAVDDFIGHR